MVELLTDHPFRLHTRVLRLDRYFLVEILKGKPIQATDNRLPADAEIVSIGHDWEGRLTAIVASAEFAVVPNNSRIPDHPDITVLDLTWRVAGDEGL